MATEKKNITKQVKTIPVKTTLFKHPVASLPLYRCCWCGNEWIPRKNAPKVCPYCHRKNYQGTCNTKRRTTKKRGK